MNKEAEHEMDALVAERVMKYRKIANPSSEWFIDRNWRGLADDVFWVDSLGVMTADINGYRQWRPSTDIRAAMDVLEKIESMPNFWRTTIEHVPATSGIAINGQEYSYVDFVFVWNDDSGTHMRNGKYSGNATLLLAISKAALLAVIGDKP